MLAKASSVIRLAANPSQPPAVSQLIDDHETGNAGVKIVPLSELAPTRGLAQTVVSCATVEAVYFKRR